METITQVYFNGKVVVEFSDVVDWRINMQDTHLLDKDGKTIAVIPKDHMLVFGVGSQKESTTFETDKVARKAIG